MTTFRFSPLPLPKTSTIGGAGFAMQPAKVETIVGTAQTASLGAPERRLGSGELAGLVTTFVPREVLSSLAPTIDEPLARLGGSTGGSRGSLIRFLTSESTRDLLSDRFRESLRADAVDISGLQIQNDEFVPANNVINNERPELIATVAFNPIWAPGELEFNGLELKNLSPAGLLVNFQYQTKQLRQETLQALIANMLNAFGDTIFDEIKSDFETEINNVETDLRFINNALQKIDTIKSSIDIKDVPESYYDNINGGPRGGVVIGGERLGAAYPTFRRFAIEQMQFNNRQYDNFSETKLLSQLLFDLNNVLENYSFGLLDITDNDRRADSSVTVVDKTYSLTNGFSFNIANFRSNTTEQYNSQRITDLLANLANSLPANPDSSIKLLVNILAKEYLISTGLGNPSNRDILSKYVFGSELRAASRTNIFDNILGNVGDNIFQLPQGLPESMARILYVEDSSLPPGNLILPFENRYITNPAVEGVTTSREVNSYIPGTSYFTDNIINTGTNQWNIKPFTDFVTKYSSIVNNAKTAIYTLLNLNALSTNWFISAGTSTGTPTSVLSPMDAFRYFVYGLQNSFKVLTNTQVDDILAIDAIQLQVINAYDSARRGEGGVGYEIRRDVESIAERLGRISTSSEQLFITALFSEAANNIRIKNILFRICLLRGVWKTYNLTYDFFDRLIKHEIDSAEKITDLHPGWYPTGVRFPPEILNRSAPGFDRARVEQAIDRYVDRVAVPNLLRELQTIGTGVGSSLTLTEINISTINTNRLSDNIKSIIKRSGRYDHERRNNLIDQCNDTAEKLLSSTKQGGFILSLLDNDSVSRFNGIDLTTQYAFIFETFVQMAHKYSGVSVGGIVRTQYVPTRSDIDSLGRGAPRELPSEEDYINVRINREKQQNFISSADEFKKVEPTLGATWPGRTLAGAQVYSDLYSIYSKLKKEFNYVRYALGIFEVIGQRLRDTDNDIRTFSNANSNIPNADIVRYPSQVRLSNFIYNNIKEKYTYADSLVTLPGGVGRAQISNIREKLIVSDAILPSEFNALVSCLSFDHPDFKTTAAEADYYDDAVFRNNRIVTVGIPAGFTKKLADRVSRGSFNIEGINTRQSDVIEIQIHPVDLRFADIVLKPITYLFDLSLFISKKNMYDLNAISGENFNALLERLRVTDLENVNNVKFMTQRQLLSNPQYNLYNDAQKRNIFLNTFRSYLFEVYINCLNGMKLSEDVFLTSNGRKTLNEKTRNLINRYLGSINERNIPGTYTTTEDILSSRLSQTVKDAYRLFTYGSLVFNDQELTRRVMTPKRFDRVLHLGVDLSRLEIDKAATDRLTEREGATRRGSPALRAAGAGALQTIGSGATERQFLTTIDTNDFIIKSIFINVATSNERYYLSGLPPSVSETRIGS